MAVSVLRLFLTVTWVGLLSVIVTFHGHSHLLFYSGQVRLKPETSWNVEILHVANLTTPLAQNRLCKWTDWSGFCCKEATKSGFINLETQIVS